MRVADIEETAVHARTDIVEGVNPPLSQRVLGEFSSSPQENRAVW